MLKQTSLSGEQQVGRTLLGLGFMGTSDIKYLALINSTSWWSKILSLHHLEISSPFGIYIETIN